MDWAFYNATGGSYIIGHGGGATMQHSYCTDISWSDAQPGDLVFYPDNSHVGIICGRDEDGSLLVIHCASGANNVVITGTSGFISVARPDYFSDNWLFSTEKYIANRGGILYTMNIKRNFLADRRRYHAEAGNQI